MKKRYIVLIIIVIVIVLIPKFVDFLFTVYLCDLTALVQLEASDILSYIGVLAVVGATITALYFSLKQFKLLNKTFIIPINKKYYFYSINDGKTCFLATEHDIEPDKAWEYAKCAPALNELNFLFRNIGKGTANNFSITISYNSGKWFHDLMSQLGYSKEQCGFQSNFEEDLYENCGIFSCDENRNLRIPFIVNGMIENICQVQYLNSKSEDKEQHMKNNILVNKEHHICSIKISSSDILDITKIKDANIYDVYIKVINSISLGSVNGVYSEVFLIMKEATRGVNKWQN